MATMQEQLSTPMTRIASDTIRLTTTPPKRREVWSIPKQLVQFAAAIAANHRAAKRVKARADLAAKMGLVLEEADEPGLCLELLAGAGLLVLLLIAPIMKQANKFSRARRLVPDHKER